ncbi:MAG: extracellular solute-binding protein [Candidatus Dojkabacteria bacterium]|nr:extracellular solute-binding protein [Candidatus Dojkabacteria bacterium]
MTSKFQSVIKITIVLLVIVALSMGGWFVYTNFLKGDESTPIEEGEIELIWWTLWEDEDSLRVLADAYTAQNPSVTIKIVPHLEKNYKERLIRQLNSPEQEKPDIVPMHNTWLPLFQRSLSPLPSTVMSESDYANAFYNVALLDFKGTDGKIYAIPLMFDGLGVYYNKTLLKNAGILLPADNWDDFAEQAKKLTQYDSNGNITVAGVSMGTASNIQFSFDIVNLLMLQEGVTMTDATGKAVFANDTEMKAGKAFKTYVDYTTRYHTWDRSLPDDIVMFTEGNLAMMFAPSWRAQNILDALEWGGGSLDFDVVPVPQQPTFTGNQKNWANYWAYGVMSNSAHSDTAWDFLRFITEQEQLRSFYEKCKEVREYGEIYPRKDMSEELISDKYVGAYVKMADTAVSWRMVDSEKVALEFNALIDEAARSGGYSVSAYQKALEGIAVTINEIITTNY